MKDMQQHYVTGRDSERELSAEVDSERHEANPCDQRDSERQPATIG